MQVVRTLGILMICSSQMVYTSNVLTGDKYFDMIREICPYNKFCTVEPALGCLETGNCCPDAQPTMHSGTLYKCVDPAELLNRRKIERNSNTAARRKYRIIDRCPQYTKNATLKTLCRYPKTLNDYVIVSESLTGKVFANEHCAKCHNALETVNWHVYVEQCTEMIKNRFKTYEDRNEYILKHCILQAEPPNLLDVEIAECMDEGLNIYSSCNITGLWTDFDDVIQSGCQSDWDMRVYFYNVMAGDSKNVYANPFCFLCNIGTTSSLSSWVCDVRETWDSGAVKDTLAGVNIQKTHSEQSQVCQSHEILDVFQNSCTELFCPLGTIPNFGNCLPLLHDFNGFTLEVYVAILFPVSLRPRAFQLHSNVLERFMSELNKTSVVCNVCRSSLVSDGSGTIFYLKLHIQMSSSCPFEKLRGVLRNLSGRGFTHKLDVESWVKNYELIIAVVAENFPTQETVMSFLLGSGSCANATRFDASIFYSCPRIEVSIADLYKAGLQNTVIDVLFQKAENNYKYKYMRNDTNTKNMSDAGNKRRDNLEDVFDLDKGLMASENQSNISENGFFCYEDFLLLSQLMSDATPTVAGERTLLTSRGSVLFGVSPILIIALIYVYYVGMCFLTCLMWKM